MKKWIMYLSIWLILVLAVTSILIGVGIVRQKEHLVLQAQYREFEKSNGTLHELLNETRDMYYEMQDMYNNAEEELEVLRSVADLDEIKWYSFTVTAYTSNDPGCNSISAIGMDIEKWSSYFDFVAVDPNVIPLGSTVVMLYEGELIPAKAVDTGGVIKGYILDWYFVRDTKAALEFGRQKLPVFILE